MTYQRNEAPEPLASEPEVKTPKKIEPGSELHFALLGVPMGWNFLTGKDYADMQAFGKAVWNAATEHAAKKEREECAKLCDEMAKSDYLPFQCATAIRNRAPCTCKPGLASEQTCEKHAAQNHAAAIRARDGKGATG